MLSFETTWIDLEDIFLSETGLAERDKYHMISYVKSNTQNRAHRYREKVSDARDRERESKGKNFQIQNK